MVAKRIGLADVPAELRGLIERDREAAMRAVRRTIMVDAHRWVQWSIRNRPRPPIDTGDYARAWKGEMLRDGGVFYSSAAPPLKAGVIEYGRRPGARMPPVEPLVDWVRRKLNVPDPKEARSIAFVVARAIQRRGLPAQRVLEDAHPKIFEAYVKNLNRELRAANP